MSHSLAPSEISRKGDTRIKWTAEFLKGKAGIHVPPILSEFLKGVKGSANYRIGPNSCLPLQKFRPNKWSVDPSSPLSKLGLSWPFVSSFNRFSKFQQFKYQQPSTINSLQISTAFNNQQPSNINSLQQFKYTECDKVVVETEMQKTE